MTDLKAIDSAVAERAKILIPTFTKKGADEGAWGHVYGGSRTQPEHLGWRFRQNTFGGLHVEPECSPEEILEGKFDSWIEATYHDAASAEHWYMYEKDWG